MQSLKSVAQARVNVGITINQAGARSAGHFDALCGAGDVQLQNDIFGRNVGQMGVDMRGAPQCNSVMPFGQTVTGHIVRENNERPYVQIGPIGDLGGGDLMGVGRDRMPQDIYGTGNRGNFVRHGLVGNLIPDRLQSNNPPPVQRREQNMNYPSSHDTTSSYNYRG